MKRAARALAAWAMLTSCASLVACATPAPTEARRAPDTIHWEIADALKGTACEAEITVAQGTRPGDTRALGRVLLSGRPRPLAAYDKVLRQLARDRCASGVSMLNAVDDGTGIVRMEAQLWERLAVAP